MIVCVGSVGSSAIRGVINDDNGGVFIRLRRITRVQWRLCILPKSLVPPIRPLHHKINGQDWFMLIFPLFLHRLSSLWLLEALVPQPDCWHVSIQSRTHHPLFSGPRTQRSLSLICITGCQSATWRHQRRKACQEELVPIHSDAATCHSQRGCAGPIEDATSLVLAITGYVLPQGEPRQQSGQVSGIVLAVFEVL